MTLNLIRRSIAAVAVAAVAVSFVAVAPVMAAEDPGYGPESAVTPSDSWRSFAPGEVRWYTLHYDYGQIADETSETIVELKSQYEDAVGFEIWNPQSVQHWINEDDTDDWSAVGADSKLSNELDFDNNEQESLSNLYKNELVWVGSSRASDTSYVIITNDSSQSQDFQISITGSSLSF